MQYQHLQIFITVADEGSFSKASEKLFTSPAAIAQQITTLEHSLNFKLFTRSYQGVKLTSAGEYFYPKAKQISALTEAAIARGSQISASRNTKMDLNIALLSGNGTPYIQKIIWRYKTAYPNAVLSFSLQSIPLGVEKLLNNELDFFESPFLTLAIQKGMHFIKLAEYPAYCIISENHPLSSKGMITLDDLNGYSIIVPSLDFSPELVHLRKALEALGNSSFSELEFNPNSPACLFYGQDIHITFYPWNIKGCRCIPLDWNEKCASGLIYNPVMSSAKKAFLKAAKELVADGNWQD